MDHTSSNGTQSLVNQLRLRRQRSSLDVHGVGGARTSQTNGVVNITLHSNYRPLSVTVQAHVLTKVTTCLPSEPPARPTLPSHLEKLNLADPQFLKSRPVDIILGADAYGTSHQVTVNNTDRQLSELLSRFWTQEEPPQDTAPLLTPEEQECEDHFKTTHSRDSAVLNNDSITSPFQYFLPHGVLKLGSTTTALRVVFNGFSPTSSGYSLNDLLHTGPNLMLNIADLLIWIRRYKHLFATDVTKMYRQIKVHPDEWSLQQILWLDDTQKETQYQLTTVTYGTKAAPYLAIPQNIYRTLQIS
ncbi:uncharacterized protein LOC143305812 [Osmia lignaria lignaria]|uniref:uncharacterized protein LOC143305812 n=1 Tax=Osmia lignaria lignaria TaxID=1437193 RepID=UPI00402B284C